MAELDERVGGVRPAGQLRGKADVPRQRERPPLFEGGSLSPRSVLARGYAHVQRLRDGRTVASTKDVGSAEGLTITVGDGRIAAVTTGQARLF